MLERLAGTEGFTSTEEAIARAIYRIPDDEKVSLPAFEAARRALKVKSGATVNLDFMSLAEHLAKINAGRPVIERASGGPVFISRDVVIEAMQELVGAEHGQVGVKALRDAGWSVAIHNDYRLAGEPHTFWLFTHPDGRWIKGEGRTDDEAIAQAHAAILPTNKEPGNG